MTTVRPGQIWRDNDPRSAPGKAVRVLSTDERYAYVEAVHGGRKTRILLNHTGAHIRNYRLVEDVED